MPSGPPPFYSTRLHFTLAASSLPRLPLLDLALLIPEAVVLFIDATLPFSVTAVPFVVAVLPCMSVEIADVNAVAVPLLHRNQCRQRYKPETLEAFLPLNPTSSKLITLETLSQRLQRTSSKRTHLAAFPCSDIWHVRHCKVLISFSVISRCQALHFRISDISRAAVPCTQQEGKECRAGTTSSAQTPCR